jgi:hypothetical protein
MHDVRWSKRSVPINLVEVVGTLRLAHPTVLRLLIPNRAMIQKIRHPRPRDLKFLGLVAVTGLTIVLYLDTGLRLAGETGSGWRKLDLDALKQKIESGELREREAEWYHPATGEETRGAGGTIP